MANREPVTISVYPTLVLGVGGTGCKIAKRLKRTIQTEGVSSIRIQFVGVDADLSERDANNEDEAPLDKFIPLGGAPVNFDPKDKTNMPILSWLPSGEDGALAPDITRLAQGTGAGGMRLLGRFAYNYFAPDRFIMLQSAVDELKSLGNNPFEWQGTRFQYQPGLAVYIIGSLVGGTGSGAFLDVVATLHRIVSEVISAQMRYFHGLFLLPSVFDYRAIGDQPFDHRATAYACLKDLDLLMTTDDPELRSFWYYNSPRPFVIQERFLDSCYLVSRYAGSGALLRDEDVYDFVATHLYGAIATPFGAASASVQNNSHKAGITDEQGGVCNYSSFGVIGIDFSQKMLLRYCSARLGAEALDLLLGDGLATEAAEADGERFLQQYLLSGARECGAIGLIQGKAAKAFIQDPADRQGDARDLLVKELEEGFGEFEQSLGGGLIKNTMSLNYREQLLSPPGALSQAPLEPGEAQREPLIGWCGRALAYIEQVVAEKGLRAGKVATQALKGQMERILQDFNVGLTELSNSVAQKEGARNNTLGTLKSLKPSVQLFHPHTAQEIKRRAVEAQNAAIQARLRQAAARLAMLIFSDETNGLLSVVNDYLNRFSDTIETVETVRDDLRHRAESLRTGSREGSGSVGSPDRSCLLYDVMPASNFPEIYGFMSDRRRQLLSSVLSGGSATRLLDSIKEPKKAEPLARRVTGAAESLFSALAEKHIFDVLVEGAEDLQQKRDKLKFALQQVTPNLRTHAPTADRRGRGHTYDYCVVIYPRHQDPQLTELFETLAEEDIREQIPGIGVTTVPCHGPNNRIIMTYMRHGYPLNDQAFTSLADWREAYEISSRNNPYLDVDRRWRKQPGPGQRNTGDARARLFTLGLAYGLIAKHGDFFYVNFHRSMLRQDDRAIHTREEYEVDLQKVRQALDTSGSPLEWFGHITRGDSEIQTVPAEKKQPLGKVRQNEARDRIGQGRTSSMQAFVEDEGEDYADVAEAIAQVMEAYATAHGRANVCEELAWYQETLEQGQVHSSALKDQFETEIKLVERMREAVQQEGNFGFAIGHL